ncbi:aspartic peptidase A1 [Suillus decipiens]|nr:aspartic peptidase A1 [Suillus decipiens]
MYSAALLTLLLVLSITGSPVKAANYPISVPITNRLKLSNSTNSLLAHDRARAQALRNPNKHGQHLTSVPLINDCMGYGILVDIGNPPRRYSLLLDSGSANTWVGGTRYVETKTSFRTGYPVWVTYGDGYFKGIEYLDSITVGPGLTVVLQSIGVASESQGLYGFDGVLGIGPVALTLDTLEELPTELIPTVTNSLAGQNTIPRDVLGIFFQPYSGSPEATRGQITFGGTDPDLYNGIIMYTHITEIKPASYYWGIDQSITYGTTEILASTAGIIDCGATYILIATEAYERYKAATGAEYDPVTKLLAISDDQYSALQPLNFHIGIETFSLIPNAQIWPRSLNSMIGGQEHSIYLIVCDISTETSEENDEGDANDFINGYVFMQRFYIVYDATNSLLGLARTPFTYATTN